MKLLLAFLLAVSVKTLYSQEVFERRNYLVIEDNDTLELAGAGGFNAPQFSKIDLNQDGILDLFAFERGWDAAIKTFVFENGSYHYAPEYISSFPVMRNWVALRDYNYDGKIDVFCWSETGAGISLYKNTSTPGNLSFEMVKELIYTDGLSGEVNLYVSSVDYPAIVDIDDDGDLDLVTFGIGGSYIEYHKNYALEDYGTCDSIAFALEESCWGFVKEDGNNNDLILNISCKGGSGGSNEGERHSGSTILAFDRDGDLDKDILLGDISYNNLVYARNGGDLNYAHMDTTISNFPSDDIPVSIELFPSGFHLDVDDDGDKDLLVAPNSPGISRDVDNIWYYENTESDDNPHFEFQGVNFLQGEMIDLGTGAHPKLVDVDGDGLLDLLIFNEYKFSSTGLYTNIYYYKNIGSETNPVFELQDENFMDFLDNQLKAANGAFGDLDDDGDLDMIVGDSDGIIHWFNNTAGVGNMMNFQLVATNYNLIDVGNNSAPFLFDVNGDNLLDLVIGEKKGDVNYIFNSGDANNPEFLMQNMNQSFGGIDVEIPCCTGYSVPFLKRNENDSIELYLGSEAGFVYKYMGLENNLDGEFNLVDSVSFLTVKVSPFLTDLDNDGFEDWFVGENYGGIQMLEDTLIGPSSITKLDKSLELNIYPNPSNDILNIDIDINDYQLEILSLTGQVCIAPKKSEKVFDISGLSEGLYLIRLYTIKESYTTRFLKISKE